MAGATSVMKKGSEIEKSEEINMRTTLNGFECKRNDEQQSDMEVTSSLRSAKVWLAINLTPISDWLPFIRVYLELGDMLNSGTFE